MGGGGCAGTWYEEAALVRWCCCYHAVDDWGQETKAAKLNSAIHRPRREAPLAVSLRVKWGVVSELFWGVMVKIYQKYDQVIK